uniref:Clavesin-2 n=1 Tax=Hirondellea gigas TaxID=1518452 RepID=A0A2P2I6W6_9CRUS
MKTLLSSPTKSLALEELNEQEPNKSEALKQMQDWLNTQPHITCRRDNSFLLRFLRFQKYRLEEAKDQLIKYLKMREDNHLWFRNLDIRDPSLTTLIDGGYWFALPEKDKAGRRVFFNRSAALDPSRNDNNEQMRAMIICFESMLEDEENQVRGFTYVMDEKDVGFSYLSLWTLGEVTKAIQCCEKTIPMRHKEVHFLNLSTALGALFEFVKSIMSDKMNSRMKVHSSLDSLYSVVDRQILPKEYGGKVPMATMIKQYREEMELVRSKVLSLDQMKIGKKVGTHNKLQRTINKVQRSFKKIDID